MTNWQVTRDQWRAWIVADAASGPAGALDEFDAEVRELLGRTHFGPATESTYVGSTGNGEDTAFESRPTLVHGGAAQDDDAEAAQTLIRGNADWVDTPTQPPGFQVGLSAPGGGLEVELEGPGPGVSSAPTPNRGGTVVAQPPARTGRTLPPMEQTPGGTVVAPAPEPAQPAGDGDGGLFIPVLTRRADTGPIVISAPDAASSPNGEAGAPLHEAEELHSAEIEAAEPPGGGGAPVVTPPPAPRSPLAGQIQSETKASASGSFMVEPEFFDEESDSGEIETGVGDPPDGEASPEISLQGAKIVEDEAAPPVMPKIVVAPVAPPAEEDAQELDEQDLVEAEAPSKTQPPARRPAAPPEPPPTRPEATPSAAAAPQRETASALAALHVELDPGLTQEPATTDWYDQAFGEHYAALDRPDTLRVADREVEFFLASAGLQPGARILDVGCGAGSHSIALARRGFSVTGIDTSSHQLRRAVRAAEVQSTTPHFVRGDMREPQVEGPFDAVLCLGTTLGYFDDATNRKCLQIMRDLLVPGGKLLLEVFNRDHVIGRLPSRSWWQGEGCLVLDEAEMNYATNRLHVHRTVVFEDGRQYDHQIYVRSFTLHELAQMCATVGLLVREVSGSRQTRGRFFGATSPEIWLLAERNER